jgi:acylphosphatase
LPDAGVTERKRLDATVHGRVQGVGFRWFVRRVAAQLNVDGWVANESDGSVRVVAEGNASQVEELASALRDGPPGAFVDRLDEHVSDATGEFHGFDIRAGGHSGD